jgi:hypothetical protein
MASISSRLPLGYFETVDSRAVYPGTFDPFTDGHRGCSDHVVILS